jgi:hypothetical protein
MSAASEIGCIYPTHRLLIRRQRGKGREMRGCVKLALSWAAHCSCGGEGTDQTGREGAEGRGRGREGRVGGCSEWKEGMAQQLQARSPACRAAPTRSCLQLSCAWISFASLLLQPPTCLLHTTFLQLPATQLQIRNIRVPSLRMKASEQACP